MSIKRCRFVALLVLGALLLTACAGFPTSGPVVAGRAPSSDDPNSVALSFLAEGPAEGAEPAQIIAGFIDAAISTNGNWAQAREFLTPEFAELWDPTAGVTVDVASQRETAAIRSDGHQAQVDLEIAPEAVVDGAGRYTISEGGAVPLQFSLARNDDGEWRVSDAPNGIVLERDVFAELYTAHDLQYFDNEWRYLVPDRRWFLNQTNVTQRIVDELITGTPSTWLADAVSSAFTSPMTVPPTINEDMVIRVEVPGGTSNDPLVAGRMLQQLQSTLAGTNVTGVELVVDGQQISGTPASVEATSVDPRALVIDGDEFGYLTASGIEPIPGIAERIASFPDDELVTSITLGPHQDVAAVGVRNGTAYRVTADGPSRIEAEPSTVVPALDSEGFVWTVGANDPSSLTAWDADLVATPLGDAWADYTSVSAVSISRDGTRIAALVSANGQQWAIVSAIQRGTNGVPTGLASAEHITRLGGGATAVTWMNPSTLVIGSESEDSAIVREQPIGGPGSSYAAPSGIAALAPGTAATNVRLLTRTGELSILRGSAGGNPSWQRSAEEIAVLGTSLGRVE